MSTTVLLFQSQIKCQIRAAFKAVIQQSDLSTYFYFFGTYSFGFIYRTTKQRVFKLADKHTNTHMVDFHSIADFHTMVDFHRFSSIKFTHKELVGLRLKQKNIVQGAEE